MSLPLLASDVTVFICYAFESENPTGKATAATAKEEALGLLLQEDAILMYYDISS
jgi:hypothetical protein